MRSRRERPTWAVVLIALAAIALPGCTDEQFRELMLTLAFGVLVMAIAAQAKPADLVPRESPSGNA